MQSKIKSVLIVISMILVCLPCYSQSKKMLLPKQSWAKQMGFGRYKTLSNGKEKFIINYDRCLDDPVYEQVQAMFKDLYTAASGGEELTDAREELRKAEENEASEEQSGDIDTDPETQLMTSARPDIAIYITWKKNTVGFNYNLSFNVEAKDAYSGKTVATIAQSSEMATTNMPIDELMSNALSAHMADFCAKLDSHKEDVENNGRSIAINFTKRSGSDIDYFSDFGGQSLNTIIKNWIAKNTVNGKHQRGECTPMKMEYSQIRIPLYDANGNSNDAYSFVEELINYLRNQHNVNMSIKSTKLGSARLVLEGMS